MAILFVFVLFSFVTISNLIGLIPYSFTITSHLIVTFSLSLSFFIGINIICILKHKTNKNEENDDNEEKKKHRT